MPPKADQASGSVIPKKAKATEVKENITPASRPGAYRMVSHLKVTVTGREDSQQWPGVICDEEMQSFLLLGKWKSKDGKDAYKFPGLFKDVHIPSRAVAVPIYLIDKKIAIFVPSNLLKTITVSGMKSLGKDPRLHAPFRSACRHAVKQSTDDAQADQEYSLAHWKAEMKNSPKATSQDTGADVVESVENVNKALSTSPRHGHLDQNEPVIRASSTDATGNNDNETNEGAQRLPIVKRGYRVFAATAEERHAARSQAAARHCGPDEARILVGNGGEFIVKLTALAYAPTLADKTEKIGDELQLCTALLAKLNGDDFQPVADFMAGGDFEPELLDDEASGRHILKHFPIDDAEACRELTVRCVKICQVANSLGMALLRYKTIEKFKILASHSVESFVRFVYVIYEMDFCNDTELRDWVVDGTRDRFYQILHIDAGFAAFMQATPRFALMVFRVLTGQPAVEDEAKSKGRKRSLTARELSASTETEKGSASLVPAPTLRPANPAKRAKMAPPAATADAIVVSRETTRAPIAAMTRGDGAKGDRRAQAGNSGRGKDQGEEEDDDSDESSDHSALFISDKKRGPAKKPAAAPKAAKKQPPAPAATATAAAPATEG